MNVSDLHILLADDDKDDCFLFQEVLDELAVNAELNAVNNGDQLMHYLENRDEPLPDVIFLDLNMPRKNGIECLTEIKHDPRYENLVIIIFSTSVDPRVLPELYDNGALYYIRKPNEFSRLKNVIQKALRLVSEDKVKQPRWEYFVLKGDSSPEIN
jgi:CheY-like chemotaxis protein